MNREQLINVIKAKRSFLCVGLDADLAKLPKHLMTASDPVFEFNKAIIDATLPYTVAYKPNLAFYESNGIKGLESLEKTMAYLKQFRNEVFTIADAKRGDIGNTSAQYAKAFFEKADYDSITVAPYMGEDSVKPFMTYPDKWVIVLALTSNKGADDFQFIEGPEGDTVYQQVLKKSMTWGNSSNMMYVVGATKATMLKEIRTIIPDHFLLVPGVGAQGGSLEEVAANGMTADCGLLVNSSRNIIFASAATDFAEKANEEAARMQQAMETLLLQNNVIW